MDNPPSKNDGINDKARSSQDTKLENELKFLECIKEQGWIREFELSLITGMSMYTVGQISRRLAKENLIHREKLHGNAGFFLWLKEAGAERIGGKLGEDIEIPDCWPHHALAIQTLNFLAQEENCSFKTEAALPKKTHSGKLPDGCLVATDRNSLLEQEISRKSGPYMRKQARNIAKRANEGTTCYVAYPYPPRICGNIDHETRQTNAIRHQWGSQDAPNIKLVRCYFDTLDAFRKMRASRFEIIDLPPLVDTPAARKGPPGVTDQVRGFRWQMDESRDPYGARRIRATLTHDGKVCFMGIFVETKLSDEKHQLLTDDDYVFAQADAENTDFMDFVHSQQKTIEKDEEGTMRLCASNAEFLKENGQFE